MRQKDADALANSVVPDQTAPRSSLIWVCTVCSELSGPMLRSLTIVRVATGLDDFSTTDNLLSKFRELMKMTY